MDARTIMDLGRIRQSLFDAGCGSEAAKDIIGTYEAGDIEGALRMMKKDRCRLMDELHENGRKVDCLDFLIRQAEKELKQADY